MNGIFYNSVYPFDWMHVKMNEYVEYLTQWLVSNNEQRIIHKELGKPFHASPFVSKYAFLDTDYSEKEIEFSKEVQLAFDYNNMYNFRMNLKNHVNEFEAICAVSTFVTQFPNKHGKLNYYLAVYGENRFVGVLNLFNIFDEYDTISYCICDTRYVGRFLHILHQDKIIPSPN